MKKLLSMLFVVVLLFSNSSLVVHASEALGDMKQFQEDIQPYWTGLISIGTSLDEEPTGYASPFYVITAETAKVNKVRIITELQEYDYNAGWKTVNKWDETITQAETVNFYSQSYKVQSKGSSYRFLYTIEAKYGNTIVDKTSGISKSKVI